jgi:hypothetical protein
MEQKKYLYTVYNKITEYATAFWKKLQKNNAPKGGKESCIYKCEMTLGCCFLSDSRNIFVQSRVISVLS